VSEVGFMMDNEILQSLARHFGELTHKINAGQEELKNDMKSEMSAVKNDISDNISAVKMTSRTA
jgi:hypothetical protein